MLVLSLAFFYGTLLYYGIGFYADSVQYVEMHIHREPGYCLFLWVLRVLFGEENSLLAAVLLQNALFSVVTAYFVVFFSKEFAFGKIGMGIIFLISLAPHIMSPLFSAENVVLSSGIMSEGLAYPFFMLFLIAAYGMVIGKKKARELCLILGLVLSLVRTQFIVTFVLWGVLYITKLWIEKKKRWIPLVVLVILVMFPLRTGIVKSYNYVFHDHQFINNTYGGVNTLANVLYVADEADIEAIQDPSAKEAFSRMYQKMVEKGYLWRDNGTSYKEKAIFLENHHDAIKYECIEDSFLFYLDSLGIKDYIAQNIEADRLSIKIMISIMPRHIISWFYNYLVLAFRGMVRSILIVHPVLSGVAAGEYLVAMIMLLIGILQRKSIKENWLLFISLLSICAVSFSTAITIMCISRYMVYNFTLFYTACFIFGVTWLKRR